jgi:hypothetical protein
MVSGEMVLSSDLNLGAKLQLFPGLETARFGLANAVRQSQLLGNPAS